MPEFQPSSQSVSVEERTAETLRYLKKATEVIQAQLTKDGEVPHWVEARISQAAAAMGMAVSYVSQRQEREFQVAQRKQKQKQKQKKRKKPRSKK